jgi:hypothetical protein
MLRTAAVARRIALGRDHWITPTAMIQFSDICMELLAYPARLATNSVRKTNAAI